MDVLEHKVKVRFSFHHRSISIFAIEINVASTILNLYQELILYQKERLIFNILESREKQFSWRTNYPIFARNFVTNFQTRFETEKQIVSILMISDERSRSH